jgi:hypothetical protein
MMNRLDLLSEMDIVYKGNLGVRFSGAGWYDNAYDDNRTHTNPALAAYSSAYNNGQYSSTTKRFHRGPSGELLDAFAFANVDLGGGQSFAVKLGKHTVYWGESLFTTFHGIAYSQAPLDGLKGASSPGIEAKEVFAPISQLSAAYQFNQEWSLRGQYFLAWRPNRLPQGGTYFGAADFLFDGPQQFALAPAGALGAVPQTGSIEPTRKPGNNFGVNLRYSPQAIPGTSFGAYYRRFDEMQPWAPILSLGPTAGIFGPFGPVGYHLAYAKDTEMYAVSVGSSLGAVSVGMDVSYRKNAALNSAANFAATGDFAGLEGARGNTWHVVGNGVYLLPSSSFYDSGVLIGELVYSHLDKVTKNPELFNGVGYASCTNAARTGPGTKDDGCATRNVWLAQVNVTPQWLQVLPSLDLSVPLSFNYGISGNGATLGGGNEGSFGYSVGLQMDYQQKYTVTLKWADGYAHYNTIGGVVANSNGNAAQNDHGWLSLSFKTSF